MDKYIESYSKSGYIHAFVRSYMMVQKGPFNEVVEYSISSCG